jgi:hypothetical protein
LDGLGCDGRHLVARASGNPDPDLWMPLHRWWNGVTWQEEPLDNVFSSDPTAASWGVNRLDVFQNFFGHLWQKTWNGAWQPWVNLDPALTADDPQLQAVPFVYSRVSSTLDVFGLRGNTLEANVWRRRFEAGVWSEWAMLPSDHLDLDAPDFDSEWEWIGSYSTWRSAMFVFLYPENLLLPSLITRRTPAFNALIEQTRPSRRAQRRRRIPDICAMFRRSRSRPRVRPRRCSKVIHARHLCPSLRSCTICSG